MTIEKTIQILPILEEKIPTALYDAIVQSGVKEIKVEFDIDNIEPGTPSFFCLGELQPATGTDFEAVPAEDYGCAFLSKLYEVAAMKNDLAWALLNSGDWIPEIALLIRNAVNELDVLEEVAAELAERAEYAQECRAEMAG